MTLVRIKRIYEPPSSADGLRILVDRLWPRGVTRDRAAIDEWLRDVAPTGGLRRWYSHAPGRADEFRRRYLLELATKEHAAALAALEELADRGDRVTLLTATADLSQSHATVLAALLVEPGTGRQPEEPPSA